MFNLNTVSCCDLDSLTALQNPKKTILKNNYHQQQKMRWVWKPLAAHPPRRRGGEKDSKYSASLLRMYFYPRRKPPTLYLPGVGSQRGRVRASVESLNRSQTESLCVLGADSSVMFTVRPLLRTCSHSIGSVVSVCIVALIYVPLLDKVSPFIVHASTPQLLFLQQPTVHRAKKKRAA